MVLFLAAKLETLRAARAAAHKRPRQRRRPLPQRDAGGALGTVTLSGNYATSGGAVYLAAGSLANNNNLVLDNNTATNGGAIYIAGGMLSINDGSLLTGNSAMNNGGAIYIASGTATISNGSTISNNSSTQNGGGVYVAGGTVTVTSSTFSDNTTIHNPNDVDEFSGGGIYVAAGTLTASNSAFTGNTAADNGGGICIESTATVSNCSFTGNTSNGYGGGGICVNGTATISNSTFSGNTDAEFGAAIIVNATAMISNCDFTGNNGGVDDAAVCDDGGNTTIISSYFTDNNTNGVTTLRNRQAPLGNLTISNSSVTGNSASGTGAAGGGIWVIGGFGLVPGALTLQNSIVSANTSSGSGPDISGAITSDLGNNLLGSALNPNAGGTAGATGPNDKFSDTPGLAPLGYYGGPTQTMPPLPDGLALGNGNASAAGLPATDERGLARTTGGKLDIGAVQTQANPFLITTAADPGQLAGQLSLREAINLVNVYPSGRSITFAMGTSGSLATINVLAPLPTSTASDTVINGSTQGGASYSGAPLVAWQRRHLHRDASPRRRPADAPPPSVLVVALYGNAAPALA